MEAHKLTPDVGIIGNLLKKNPFSHIIFKEKLVPFSKIFKEKDYSSFYYYWINAQYEKLYVCPCTKTDFPITGAFNMFLSG